MITAAKQRDLRLILISSKNSGRMGMPFLIITFYLFIYLFTYLFIYLFKGSLKLI